MRSSSGQVGRDLLIREIEAVEGFIEPAHSNQGFSALGMIPALVEDHKVVVFVVGSGPHQGLGLVEQAKCYPAILLVGEPVGVKMAPNLGDQAAQRTAHRLTRRVSD